MTAMPYEPGRLLLVTYPFSDQTGLKQRPVLVVSGIGFNEGEDVVVVPLSSRVIPDDRFGFAIRATDPYFAQTRLRTSSTVKWTKPMVISSKVVNRKLGVVTPVVLKEIQGLIRSIFV
jgi:mRNA-degrading endonuclease toxin of MazEF toxin-antitoxin module